MTKVDRLLLHTDIVIHLLKKRAENVERYLALRRQRTEFLLSPIVVAEVYATAFERELPQIEGFFRLCRLLTLDPETERLAGGYASRYRKAFRGISLEGYLLAATAKRQGCPLWTGNGKDYPMPDIVLFEEGA